MKSNEFNAAVARAEVSKASIAKALSITPGALSKKIKGRTPFKVDELKILIPLLHLTREDVDKIFLDTEVT